MGENSKIEWTDHTFNPWMGCSKVSAGCANCYAESLMDKRWGKAKWGPAGTRVVASESYWKQPVRWNAKAAADGVRARVFCASLADVFEDRADVREARARLFRLIVETPALDWLLLTKRPENAARLSREAMQEAGCPFSDADWTRGLPGNVWLGTSVENKEAADERIPHLRAVPARVRFLSMEPLLGPIPALPLDGIHWVIVGGESGHGARPMHPNWARSLRDQCVAAGVAFHHKQNGAWSVVHDCEVDDPDGGRAYAVSASTPKGRWLNAAGGHGFHGDRVVRVVPTTKHAAGRLLDGRTWDEVPRG